MMETMEDIVNFLKPLGVGPRPADDSFFNNTYDVCKVFERLGVTVEDEEELCHEVSVTTLHPSENIKEQRLSIPNLQCYVHLFSV